MSSKPDDEITARRYLLSKLTSEEREQFEKRILVDDAAWEELQAVQEDLIDDAISGDLTAEEKSALEEKILVTEEGRQNFRLTRALKMYASSHSAKRDEAPLPAKTGTPWSWRQLFSLPAVRIAAFAAVVLVAALIGWRVFLQKSDVDKGLLALNSAYSQQRPLESRISKFDYAPFAVMRGGEPERVNSLERQRAERILLDAVRDRPGAASHHALGDFYLAAKDFDRAIQQFEEALQADPTSALSHADLGTALLEQGKAAVEKGKSEQNGSKSGEGFQLLARSLTSLSKATELDPNLLEPLFNKALCLEYMLLPEKSKEAWEAYLAKDSNSRWAEEARRHLANLSSQSWNQATPEQLLERFLAAFQQGNEDTAWQVLSANREPITGRMLIHQFERGYQSTLAAGQPDRAKALLNAFVYAGELERRKGNDSYVSDLADYYASATEQEQAILAKALGKIDQGYKLCLETKYADAAEEFEQASGLFSNAGNLWEANLANYWISYCYTQLDRIPESIEQLKAVSDYCNEHKYKWLQAQAEGWLGIDYSTLSEHSNSIDSLKKSLELATGINDTYQMQRSLTGLGNESAYLQQPTLALGYFYLSLSIAAESGGSSRQAWRNLLNTTSALFKFEHYEAAEAFGREALALGEKEFKDPTLTYLLHDRLGQIYNRLQRFDLAIQQAKAGITIAQSVLDPAARQKATAGAFLNQAQILRESGNHALAAQSYEQAITLYDTMNFDLHRYVAYKGRLLNELELNDQIAVDRDIPVLLNMFERYRAQIREEQYRNSFFDTEQSVYDIAVQHEYQNRNYVKAIDYAEASHGRSLLAALQQNQHAHSDKGLGNERALPLDVEAIRPKLPETLSVLMFTVLPKKLLIWKISRREISVEERQITAEALKQKVGSFVSALREGQSDAALRSSGQELYRLLIGEGNERQTGKQLCIVPDKFLYALPFAALASPLSGKYLVEEDQLLYAPSLNVMLNCSEEAQRRSQTSDESVVSIGNPSFNQDAHSLPLLKSAEREATEIARNFGRSTVFLGRAANKTSILQAVQHAEVIHFAGHYLSDEANPMMSKMLLAANGSVNSNSESSELTASEIIQHEFGRTRLVVLSACQTGLDRYYNGEGAVGLARAFLKAGIPLVVASQWPVDSDATADLMVSMYRHRKSGVSTAEALRAAQVEMLHGANEASRPPRYWAAFVCVGANAVY